MLERVCLFNSSKVTWAEFRSLKTDLILSVIDGLGIECRMNLYERIIQGKVNCKEYSKQKVPFVAVGTERSGAKRSERSTRSTRSSHCVRSIRCTVISSSRSTRELKSWILSEILENIKILLIHAFISLVLNNYWPFFHSFDFQVLFILLNFSLLMVLFIINFKRPFILLSLFSLLFSSF